MSTPTRGEGVGTEDEILERRWPWSTGVIEWSGRKDKTGVRSQTLKLRQHNGGKVFRTGWSGFYRSNQLRRSSSLWRGGTRLDVSPPTTKRRPCYLSLHPMNYSWRTIFHFIQPTQMKLIHKGSLSLFVTSDLTSVNFTLGTQSSLSSPSLNSSTRS